MRVNLPFEVLYILHLLNQHGFPGFLVGGAVRDLIMGAAPQNIKDYDFTSAATPETIQKILAKSFYENQFGTVSIAHQNLLELIAEKHQLPTINLAQLSLEEKTNETKIIDLKKATKIHFSLQDKLPKQTETISNTNQYFPPFEITTFRSDGQYLDHRRPETISYGQNIETDLSRRDFTINALALAINPQVLEAIFQNKVLQSTYLIEPTDAQLIDLYQGQKDIQKKIVRTVGNPDQRFTEDALRMLRAIRLAVQLKMDIATETYFAIKFHHHLLKFVSFERIRDEFLKILASDDPRKGVEMLDQAALLQHIIPELYAGVEMQQRGHHTTDVWTHSLDALHYCPSKDPIVRLATLIHDIGKPPAYKEENQEITFYNHEVLGSRMASKIANRLKLSKKDVQRIFILVRYHMFHYQENHSDASIRRFIKRVGFENIDDLLDLREGDRLGSGAKKTSWRLEEMKQRIIEQLNQPMDLHDLAIDGHILMEELNLQPGPVLGKILNKLLEKVLENPDLNSKTQLLIEAKKLLD